MTAEVNSFLLCRNTSAERDGKRARGEAHRGVGWPLGHRSFCMPLRASPQAASRLITASVRDYLVSMPLTIPVRARVCAAHGTPGSMPRSRRYYETPALCQLPCWVPRMPAGRDPASDTERLTARRGPTSSSGSAQDMDSASVEKKRPRCPWTDQPLCLAQTLHAQTAQRGGNRAALSHRTRGDLRSTKHAALALINITFSILK